MEIPFVMKKLPLISAALTALVLAACGDQPPPFAVGVNSAPVSGPNPSTTEGFFIGNSASVAAVAPVPASASAGTPARPGTPRRAGDSATAISQDFTSFIRTVSTGVNQNVVITPDGNQLITVGMVNGLASVRTLADLKTRGTRAFTAGSNGDKEVTYSNLIKDVKGVTLVGTTKLVLSDNGGAPGNTAGGMFVVNVADTGTNVTPAITFTNAQLGGNAWDAFYDAGADRLFVALTNGKVAIFDAFNTLTAAKAADRTITPVDAMGNPFSPTNLHGVVFANNRLLLTDVGAGAGAGSDTDGRIYVVPISTTATGNKTATVIQGSATNLGNPVDAVLKGTDFIVAEKANRPDGRTSGAILVFRNIFNTAGGNIAPNLVQMAGSGNAAPESIAIVP
jgi:hypothetical protein